MTRDYETPPLPFAGDPDRTCPYCGYEEPNDLLLRNNHGHDSALTASQGICIAMDLTRNHVLHDLQQVLDARAVVATARLQGRSTKPADRSLQQAQGALNRSIARVRDVWPDPAWLTDALTPLTDPSQPPE